MTKSTLLALEERVGKAKTLDAELLHEITEAVSEVFPKAPAHPEALAEPAEAVLHLIDRCLPGWSISLAGKATEPDGHWRCHLRESSTRDNDEVIGFGRGPTVTLALLQALLKVAILKS